MARHPAAAVRRSENGAVTVRGATAMATAAYAAASAPLIRAARPYRGDAAKGTMLAACSEVDGGPGPDQRRVRLEQDRPVLQRPAGRRAAGPATRGRAGVRGRAASTTRCGRASRRPAGPDRRGRVPATRAGRRSCGRRSLRSMEGQSYVVPERTPVAASRFSGSGANPRSRRLLVTTKTELNAIAAPAIIGLSSPAAASGSAATL